VKSPPLPEPLPENPMNRTARLRPELQSLADRLPVILSVRLQAPEVVSRFFFPITQRTLERESEWPLPRHYINGLVCVTTIELLCLADQKLRAAGVVLPNYDHEEPATAPVAEAAA
jgi:hypothetical protein